jgi:hypothetical protein
MMDQFSLERIHVHVVQFLDELGLTPHVEIIKAVLPKPGQRFGRIAERKLELSGGGLPSRLASQAARHALFQDLQDGGRSPHAGFADEQMNVVGHDNVAHQGKPVAIAHFSQNLHKQIPRVRRGQQGQSPIATEGDEMEMALSIPAMESSRHGKSNQKPRPSKSEGRGTPSSES